MANISDFGEKIGGARKDEWKLRGLMLDDLQVMTELERKNLIKKDNVWPKPDWEQLIKDGMPQGVAYWQHRVRQSLPASPGSVDPEVQEQYISFIRDFKDMVMSVKDFSGIDRFYNEKIKNVYVVPTYGRYVNILPEYKDLFPTKVLKAVQISSYESKKEAKEKLFGIPKEEQTYHRIKNRLTVLCYDDKSFVLKKDDRYPDKTVLSVYDGFGTTYGYLKKENPFHDPSLWEKDTFVLFDTESRTPVSINIETREQALNDLESLARKMQEKENAKEPEKNTEKTNKRKQKKRFTPPQLEGFKREGPYHRGIRNATSEMFLQDLKFRGGEFGNWLNENDRLHNMNMSYDALRDLALILKIRPEDVSLGGKLAIAFGARGKGGKGAGAAHYEPDRQVINLTKMSGAGCLAHEWGHALDHSIGIACGGISFASEEQKIFPPDSFRDLLHSMRYKKVTLSSEQISDERNKRVAASQKRLSEWLDYVKPRDLTGKHEEQWNTVCKQLLGGQAAVDSLDYVPLGRKKEVNTCPAIEMLSQIRKAVSGHGITRDEKQKIARCAYYVQNDVMANAVKEPEMRTVETDYYKGSKAFDDIFSQYGHGYWSSELEMFARAFDCYVADKLKESGLKSDYLTAFSDCFMSPDDKGVEHKAFPTGDERKLLNEKFDILIQDLKDRGILHAYEYKHERSDPAPKHSGYKTTAPMASTSVKHFQQMSFDDLLFSAESRKQEHKNTAPTKQEPTR